MSGTVKYVARQVPAKATGQASGPAARITQLHKKFPPRQAVTWWPRTAESAEAILGRLDACVAQTQAHAATRSGRRKGVIKVLDWLSTFPGDTWQDRWLISGAEERGGPLSGARTSWADLPAQWLVDQGRAQGHDRGHLASGLLMLLSLDVIHPRLAWMLTRGHPYLAPMMAQLRDPTGFTKLDRLAAAGPESSLTDARVAATRIAILLASKGGVIAEITVGDCVELIDTMRRVHARGGQKKIDFYLRLRALGVFPEDAPHSIRAFGAPVGQLTIEQLVDRYPIRSQQIRTLIIEYLRERQPALDYTSLNTRAKTLAGLFWSRLELLTPGIDSLNLSPETARAWKEDLSVVRRTRINESGARVEVTRPRQNFKDELIQVRGFYLDLAHWAIEDPARWGPWVAPCPISDKEIQLTKDRKRRKARIDQRTRERLSALPQLLRSANERRTAAAMLLSQAEATRTGRVIAGTDGALRRIVPKRAVGRVVWAEDTATGARRDLSYEEDEAFWAFATIEVLRLTGVRHEELLELSHHSITEYRLPSTGELVPLLQIAPSKSNTERLLLVSPELADVLSAIVQRSRTADGSMPVVAAYDPHEKLWNPPMPLLFQRAIGNERRAITPTFISKLMINATLASGITDAEGNLMTFQPHDFRRMFVTDAIMNGLPPHIAQVICGHKSIDTTMGYKAVYPAETIEAHRAFVARRRASRPGEEYRTPTTEEWDEFLSHFEKRKVSVGTCARAFGTPCIHEHACVRCSLLQPDPSQRPRLEEIRANLEDRIIEAKREGWLGEIEGLQISYSGVKTKLAQLDSISKQQNTATDLGLPTFRAIVARSVAPQAPKSWRRVSPQIVEEGILNGE